MSGLVKLPWTKDLVSLRGILVVIGATAMLISSSLDFSYGNLNTYVISYLRSKDAKITYADWIFISQTKVLVGGLFGPLSGVVAENLGVKPCLIIGCLIYTGGYFLTFWSLDIGLWACAITIAAGHGIGYGLTYPVSVAATLKWFPPHLRGLFGSIAVSGYGFGSVIWNPLETAFVNPNNTQVELTPGDDDLYFTDEAVLNRVPQLFLLLGGCIATLQIPALLLIKNPTEGEANALVLVDDTKNVDDEYQISPRKVIRLPDFWKLYMSFLSLTMLSVFISNYQKAFGQKFIQDDKFFALVSIVQNVANGSARLMWGFSYDRLGFKTCLVIISSVCTMVAFTFGDLVLFEPNTTSAKIFFASYVCGLYLFLPGSFSCYPPVINAAFGSEHCSSNYGLIFTSAIWYSLALIILTQTVFDVIGYSGIFMLTGFIGMLGMLAILLFPKTVSSQIYKDKLECQ